MYARLLQSFIMLKPMQTRIQTGIPHLRIKSTTDGLNQLLPYIFSYSDVITVRNICCYFSFIMLLNTIVLNYFSISRATLDYICQALKAWAKISSVSSWLFTLKSHYEKSDAYPVYFHMWKRPRMEWSDSFTLIQKQICITHQGKNSAVWM